MLKDVTLGQYFPGQTPIHKLDPRTKLVFVILYIVVLFLAKWFVSYLLVAAFLGAVIWISKDPPVRHLQEPQAAAADHHSDGGSEPLLFQRRADREVLDLQDHERGHL